MLVNESKGNLLIVYVYNLMLFFFLHLDKGTLSNSGLQEDLTNLLEILLLRQKQTQQNPRLLRVVHATGNLSLSVIAHDISSRNLAVDGAVRQNNGDVVLLHNLDDSRSEISGDTSSTLTGNLVPH